MLKAKKRAHVLSKYLNGSHNYIIAYGHRDKKVYLLIRSISLTTNLVV